MTADAVVGEARFGVERSAASRARSFLRADLGCLGVAAEVIDTTVLLATELVTNAVLHARTDLVLRYVLHAYCVRIEVLDGNSSPPTPVAASLDATSGRGLALVESLANSWASSAHPKARQSGSSSDCSQKPRKVPSTSSAPEDEHRRDVVGVRSARWNSVDAMTLESSPRDTSAALAEALQASVALEALAVAGMGVWNWDVVTGVFTWDDQIARLHGIGPSDFDGTLASFLSRVRPEDEPGVSAAFQKALHRGGEFRTEFRVVRPDGTTAWIQHGGTAMLDASGSALRMFGIGSDTTELLAAREQVGGTLEHIIDGVLLVDLAWRIVLTNANAARIVRRSVVDLVGQNLWEVRPDVIGTEFWDRCHEAMRTHDVADDEFPVGVVD